MYGEFIKQSMQSLGRELLSAVNYSVQEINLERLLMLKLKLMNLMVQFRKFIPVYHGTTIKKIGCESNRIKKLTFRDSI